MRKNSFENWVKRTENFDNRIFLVKGGTIVRELRMLRLIHETTDFYDDAFHFDDGDDDENLHSSRMQKNSQKKNTHTFIRERNCSWKRTRWGESRKKEVKMHGTTKTASCILPKSRKMCVLKCLPGHNNV